MRGHVRNSSIVGGVLLVTAAAVGYGWYWYTTPALPHVDLTGAPPAVVRAVEEAEHDVRQSPRSAQAWGKLGLVLYANDYQAPAHECFIHAERFDPDAAIWPYLQAVRLLIVEREKGIAPLERAMARADSERSTDTLPHLGTPHVTLAEVYIEEGRNRDAKALCERVLALDPNHPRAHLDLGLIALADDQPELTIEHLTRCLASPYTAYRASLYLAAAYRRLGETASATAFQRRAKELPPEQPWPDPYVQKAKEYEAGPRRHAARAEQLAQRGQPGEHLGALREMAAEAGDSLSHYRLGMALAQTGDYTAAEPVLKSALKQSPQLFSARFALGVVLLRQGEQAAASAPASAGAAERFRKAADELRAAIEQRPTYGLAHLSLGQALRGLGRSDDALAEFRLAVACQPELADAHLELGEALADAGQHQAAQRQLEQAQSLAPADPRAQAALARLRNAAVKQAVPQQKAP